MKYRNAKNILPDRLLKEIQEYIHGEAIYIPTSEKRVGWGQKNGTRTVINERNYMIYSMYTDGYSIKQISREYNLSESSIRKIVTKSKKNQDLSKLPIAIGGYCYE